MHYVKSAGRRVNKYNAFSSRHSLFKAALFLNITTRPLWWAITAYWLSHIHKIHGSVVCPLNGLHDASASTTARCIRNARTRSRNTVSWERSLGYYDKVANEHFLFAKSRVTIASAQFSQSLRYKLRDRGPEETRLTSETKRHDYAQMIEWTGPKADNPEGIDTTKTKRMTDNRKSARSRRNRRRRDLFQFNAELHRLSQTGTAASAERAERLLFNRIREYRSEDGSNVMEPSKRSTFEYVDVVSFNSVLNAWAKCGGTRGPERAEVLLGRMEYLYEASALSFPPNEVSYGTVIDAWARSGRGRYGAAEAERILHRIEDAYRDKGKKEDRGKDGVVVVLPNTRMYASVLHAYAKSGERGSAQKAEELLKRMKCIHSAGGKRVDSQSDSTLSRDNVDLKPNAVVYTSIIDALGKSGEKGSALKAESLLKEMINLYRSGDESMKPTVVSYAAVINAWANSAGGVHAAERAEEILRKLELDDDEQGGVRPNAFVYTNAIKAWGRSGDPKCGERAESILRRMQSRRHAGPDECPNAVTITAVINAWTRSGDTIMAPRHAERLLGVMEKLYKAGNKDMAPDTKVFSTIIAAWARSPEAGSSLRSEETLRRMYALYNGGNFRAKPNALCFATVIDAHLRSAHLDVGNFRRAVDVLRWIENDATIEDIKLNIETYKKIFHALGTAASVLQKINSDEASHLYKLMEETLHICRKQGEWVAETELALREAAPEEFWQSLVGQLSTSSSPPIIV